MRKIESQMTTAISRRDNWSKSNTQVTTDSNGDSSVYLHGHRIATVHSNNDITLSSCGWETVTTKSRLNAILDTFLHGASIFQKDWQWYFDDLQTPFFDGFKVRR
mgnify:CR=1 FL=1